MTDDKIFEKQFLEISNGKDISKTYEFLYSLKLKEVVYLLNKFVGSVNTSHTIKDLVIKHSRDEICQFVRRNNDTGNR